MNRLEKLESSLLTAGTPKVKVGQTVRVYLKIVEGDKERTQVYEGVVIGRRGTGYRERWVIRKVSYGVGVERVFPAQAPFIQRVDILREGDARRAKLYYLRHRSGRSARLVEKKITGEKEEGP